MSDLQARNTAAMISATDKFQSQVSELRLMIVSMNAKITTLTNEIEQLKRESIMAKVTAQQNATGHGGTA